LLGSTNQAAIPVIAAVVQRGNKFLICQRPAHKRHGGMWEFPGGKCEPGERLLDAARRELHDELGVTVIAIGDRLYSVADAGSAFVIEFVPTSIEGEPVCIEHPAILWATLDELDELNLAPSDRRFVEFLKNG
jgi:8-oxo-dGTP diphosphatase